MSNGNDTVSIVIVTHNSMPPLENCLKSIRAGANGTSLEIIAVDNVSDDRSPEIVQEYFPEAKVIRNDRNVGFGSACNIAAKEAEGDYLLFLNPDVVVDNLAIEKLLQVCRSKKNAGAVAGRMRFPDGSFQATCRQLPKLQNIMFSRGSVLSRFLGRDSERYTLPDYDDTTAVPATAGTMLMIHKRLFESIGGFDTNFFMFLEDVDLCLRIGREGYQNYFVPEAGGVHLWGKGSRAGKFKRNVYHHHNVWKYFVKHYPGILTYFVLPIVLLANLTAVTLLPVKQPIARKR